MLSYIRLLLLDIAKGTNVLSWYTFFRRSLRWNEDRIKQYQAYRIRKLVQHAYLTVPYYKELFDKFGISPSEIQCKNDLKKIPVLDRDEIRKNQTKLVSLKFEKKSLVNGSSSGTTGIPIIYYHDKQGISAGNAAGYVLWSMSGWVPGQRSVHIWGNETSIKQWKKLSSRIKNRMMHQLNIPSVELNDSDQLLKISKKIISHSPVIIDGYTSALHTLAKYFKTNKLHLSSLKRVITTAENLTFQQKELIESVLAPTGDLYGCGEILGIATRPVGCDKYFILDTHVVVEVEPCLIDGMYDIIVTDLDNYGMPMIRYKIGDVIDDVHLPSPENKYSLHWFKKIYGRSSDVVRLPNGKVFHPVNIFGGALFREFTGITRHKVIWNGTTLRFVFEARDFKEYDKLQNALKELLEPYQVSFDIQILDRIDPSHGGKYKYMEIIDKFE